jgi:arylsulfatase A-like enzyme
MNLLFIISDNQSPWTLGCYGNREIATPHLDALATQGARFDQARCVNPVCSPNRATLLTGLMPSQHGVHSWLGREKPCAQMGEDAYCTIAEFANLPELLAERGYNCGLSGKWHLGDSLRPQLGFSDWFTMPKGHTARFCDAEAIQDGESVTQPGYYPAATTEHALDFLGRQDGETPFFLYVGYNLPYGLDQDIREDGHPSPFAEHYAERSLSCFPDEPVHPWLRTNTELVGAPSAAKAYAAAVTSLDHEVGCLLAGLSAQGLADDTLVVFTADHGLCGGHHGVWGMGDHCRPLTMYEENLRVPLICRVPGAHAGVASDAPINNYDVFPTLLELLGLDPGLAADSPGATFAPALAGDALDWQDRLVFHEYENTRTVRGPRWKLTRRHPDGPDELYDLAEDPGEARNLVDAEHTAAAVAELDEALTTFFSQYRSAAYDLWQDGDSKAG